MRTPRTKSHRKKSYGSIEYGTYAVLFSLHSHRGVKVIPPFLGDLDCRIHAAVFCFNFWTGVIPPSPMLGRSLL